MSGHSATALRAFSADHWRDLLHLPRHFTPAALPLSSSHVHWDPLGARHVVLQKLAALEGTATGGAGRFWSCRWADRSRTPADNDEIRFLRHHDALTGLLNRSGLADGMPVAQGSARAQGHRAVLVVVDLLGLSSVNRRHGSQGGDSLLRGLARQLSDLCGRHGLAARTGPTRFAAWLPLGPADEAAPVAQRVQQELAGAAGTEGLGVMWQLVCGCAVFPDDAIDLDTLLSSAELAVEGARASRRVTPLRLHSGEVELVREQDGLREDLQHALDRAEFELYYQPRVRAEDGRIIGVEALLRWHHPELGLVSPARFIPLAEESGQIARIGSWVLREACYQAHRWGAAGPLSVAVNLSPAQLAQPGLIDDVFGALRDSGLPAERLELEITEGMLLEGGEQVECSLRAIRALGVDLALDDFGTGYSSLAYLQRLPLTYLKIDRAFIASLDKDPRQAIVAEAIIDIGRRLDLTLIAEGVENLAQLQWLLARGCRQIQGYLFSPPLSVPDLDRVLFTTRQLSQSAETDNSLQI